MHPSDRHSFRRRQAAFKRSDAVKRGSPLSSKNALFLPTDHQVVGVVPVTDNRFELRKLSNREHTASLHGLVLIERPVAGGSEVSVHPLTTWRILDTDEIPRWGLYER